MNNTPTIVEFKTVGSTTWTVPQNVKTVEYLIVGGGGGGGGGYDTGAGGGGGGGMVKTGTISVISGTTYSIVIGKGGDASTTNYNSGPKETEGGFGGNTIFGSITAYGGFGGYQSRANNGVIGRGGFPPNSNTGSFGGSGGGNAGSITQGSSGGGGGANGNGGNGSSGSGGLGGAGVFSSINDTNTEYGKGGNGARGNTNTTGANGLDNTGAGGGGGSYGSFGSRTGGSGGSGIIIIKYSIEIPKQNNNARSRSNVIRMFGIDPKKSYEKGYSRGINNTYGTLGKRRR